MSDQAVELQKQDIVIDILLAEDNEADAKIALRAFNKVRFKNNIFIVHDGQETLDFVYHQGKFEDKAKYPRPGLIILDINMPKMDGINVLKKIKEDPKYRSIPVIMLTSSKREEDVLQSYNFGASSYILKPVEYEDFVQVVDSFNSYWHNISILPPQPHS